MTKRLCRFSCAWVPVLAAAISSACGGGGYGGNSSSPTAPTGGNPSPAAITITLSEDGASPKQVQIANGQRVMFINRDSRVHEVMSDPHPIHNNCPPVNEVGRLAPGGSGQTGSMSLTGTCGFHDNLNDGDSRFRGQILIGTDVPGPSPGYVTPR